uniref:ATP synthase complex subunit 8 n=1 Tax=Roxasellana stellata TaxID=2754847 RepID=A0A8K2ATU5_9HEMI|nr:ATP synthase F0 subunit 8 [Roxasellana stellata]
MPQMAPMWWTFIMTITLMLMLTMISINYFNFEKKIQLKFINNKNHLNWKW